MRLHDLLLWPVAVLQGDLNRLELGYLSMLLTYCTIIITLIQLGLRLIGLIIKYPGIELLEPSDQCDCTWFDMITSPCT